MDSIKIILLLFANKKVDNNERWKFPCNASPVLASQRRRRLPVGAGASRPEDRLEPKDTAVTDNAHRRVTSAAATAGTKRTGREGKRPRPVA